VCVIFGEMCVQCTLKVIISRSGAWEFLAWVNKNAIKVWVKLGQDECWVKPLFLMASSSRDLQVWQRVYLKGKGV